MRHFCNITGKTGRNCWSIRSGNQGWQHSGFSFCVLAFLLISIAQSAFPTALQAKEPYLEFVQGLRERQYFDSAMLYLQSLETRENVPEEIKQVIPFEKAVTMLRSSQFSQNPDAQSELLDQAQAYLEQFIKNSPRHELVARANTELARILLGKAQVLTWKSRSPANKDNRLKFQQDARKNVAKAKVIFQKAHDAYKKQWESYGVYIPEEEKEKRAARKKVEGLYMRSQLDLATCTYEDAQTYDRDSKEFKDKLRTASLEFEEVHTKYRSQYAGLYARTMQGKCFEEQDDIRKALGIYDELLSHPGKSPGLIKLQNQVLHFRLICLNHETRKDFQLVIQEASDWLKRNGRSSRTQVGLGIRWELARAQEALATDRNTPEAERGRLLRQALENVRQINRYASPYKDVSRTAIQRILVLLDREPGDPKDFDSAFGSANSLLDQVGPLREKVKEAEKSKDQKKIQNANEELQAQLSETERIYRLALALADDKSPAKQINSARYKLAYIFYLQRKNYDAAVVGKYLAIRLKKDDPTVALDAAYLAMAGFSQAYNDAPQQYKEKNLQLILDISQFIATNWPNSDRATDARLGMGRILRRSDKPLEAAKWYAEVPATAPQYPTAQLETGQALWAAYLNIAFKESTSQTPEELNKMRDQAAKHLEVGITKMQEKTPASKPAPTDLVRAKVSLSQIEIMRGNDAKAIEWLTKDPHSVVKAIHVEKEQDRPKEDINIKSTAFASLAYQYLLRAYIGTRQLDKAEQARSSLEKIAGASGGAALTAVYVELGRELQQELERLKKLGDQERLEKVRSGFESFLSQLAKRKGGQSYSSLIWIAETYFSMAQGSKESPQKASQYYSDATGAFEEILERGENDPDFIDPARLDGVKLRLVNCKRQERDFETAESLIKSVLKKNSKALDAQIEAALVYQDWGEYGGEPKHFLDAVRGKKFKDGTVIWGWGNIAKRLQMSLNAGQSRPEYKEKHREAQYQLAQSRYLYAQNASGPKEAKEQLQRAKIEITTFTSLTPDLPDTPWWDKFDTLYQDIQQQLGEVATPLTRPELIAQDAGKRKISQYDAAAQSERDAEEAPEVEKKPKKQKAASNTMSYILMGVVLLAGIGFIGFLMTSGKKAEKRLTTEIAAELPDTFEFPAPPAEEQPAPRKKTATKRPEGDPKAARKKAPRPQRPDQKSRGEKPRGERPRGEKPRGEKPAEGAPRKRVRKKPPTDET